MLPSSFCTHNFLHRKVEFSKSENHWQNISIKKGYLLFVSISFIRGLKRTRMNYHLFVFLFFLYLFCNVQGRGKIERGEPPLHFIATGRGAMTAVESGNTLIFLVWFFRFNFSFHLVFIFSCSIFLNIELVWYIFRLFNFVLL